jgi:hypothetical protein
MFESKRTIAAVGRVAILLGWITFAAVLPCGGFAVTLKATKPSTSQEATPKQIQQLMTLLADPMVRNWREGQSKPEAAYAAPLILLAQTRQADRDATHSLADAEHREALHSASEQRAALVADQTGFLVEMLRQNTQVTETVKALTERVEALTLEVHRTVVNSRTP